MRVRRKKSKENRKRNREKGAKFAQEEEKEVQRWSKDLQKARKSLVEQESSVKMSFLERRSLLNPTNDRLMETLKKRKCKSITVAQATLNTAQ